MTRTEIDQRIAAANLSIAPGKTHTPRFLVAENETRALPQAVDMTLINSGTASAILVNRHAEGLEIAPGEAISLGRKGVFDGLQLIAQGTTVRVVYYA